MVKKIYRLTMGTHQSFEDKWKNVSGRKRHEEFSIFVPIGKKPKTQRQFNLYNYYEFVSSVIKGKKYNNAIEIKGGYLFSFNI